MKIIHKVLITGAAMAMVTSCTSVSRLSFKGHHTSCPFVSIKYDGLKKMSLFGTSLYFGKFILINNSNYEITFDLIKKSTHPEVYQRSVELEKKSSNGWAPDMVLLEELGPPASAAKVKSHAQWFFYYEMNALVTNPSRVQSSLYRIILKDQSGCAHVSKSFSVVHG